jgi:hypothetical protein
LKADERDQRREQGVGPPRGYPASGVSNLAIGTSRLGTDFCRLMPLLLMLVFTNVTNSLPAAEENAKETKPGKAYVTESLTGKVVWLADALKERFGIKSDDDVALAVVALETPAGQLHPIVKDSRGRAFHTDERLRDIDAELLVRRYEGSPMVQVVRVYAIKPDGKYELDYWCDVCSIAMYELKPCECCQGPTRLRERKVEEKKP